MGATVRRRPNSYVFVPYGAQLVIAAAKFSREKRKPKDDFGKDLVTYFSSHYKRSNDSNLDQPTFE